MGDTPTTGEVKVVLKLETTEAKAKVAEVERQLRNNERSRRLVVERVNKDGFGAKTASSNMGQTIADRLLQKVMPKPGGYNPQLTLGPLARFAAGAQAGFKGIFQQGPGGGAANLAGNLGNMLGRAGGFVNPFPPGGVSGQNAAGGAGSTVALAKVLYTALDKGAKFAGLAGAYKAKSGAAFAKTPEGVFLNELNSAFSYINNYLGSYKDAEARLADWDDAVAAVTGKLPDTQFYRPKFQRMAAAERQFQEMVTRNAGWTKAGALGNSAAVDQIEDALAHSIGR